ncbi:hypothetical protein EYC80_008179 [Monilinia laxa]|uniref:Uncharacterized protein n=1 Tax=Monilinia laxa TaxID=61186 RepID=A0A5N6JVP5_MONLA|nr:hypothetical protein EYC80_008179 [Monilinia laxa]
MISIEPSLLSHSLRQSIPQSNVFFKQPSDEPIHHTPNDNCKTVDGNVMRKDKLKLYHDGCEKCEKTYVRVRLRIIAYQSYGELRLRLILHL